LVYRFSLSENAVGGAYETSGIKSVVSNLNPQGTKYIYSPFIIFVEHSAPSLADLYTRASQCKAIMTCLECLQSENNKLHAFLDDLTTRIVEVEFENHNLKQLVIEMKCQENESLQITLNNNVSPQYEISNIKNIQEALTSWVHVVKGKR
jgi:hypothetical protein